MVVPDQQREPRTGYRADGNAAESSPIACARRAVSSNPAIRRLTVALFVLGLAAFSSALYFRAMLNKFEVSSIELSVGLEGLKPAVRCIASGHNPFPLPLRFAAYRVTVGRNRLPVALELSSQRPFEVPSGAFTVTIPMVGDDTAAALVVGNRLSTRWLEGLDYNGELLFAIGPMQHQVTFSGVWGSSQ